MIAQIAAAGQRLQTLRALRHRNFRWFWFSASAQSTGLGMQFLILGWLVLERTDSATQLGLMIFLYPAMVWVIVGNVPLAQLATEPRPIATTAEIFMGKFGVGVISAAAVLAQLVDLEQQRRLVFAARREELTANDQKTSRVISVVFDICEQYAQFVDLRCSIAGDGSGIVFVPRAARAFSIAPNGNRFDAG